MHSLRITYLVTVLLAGMATVPVSAHHGSSIAAGFFGAGLGMITGMAFADDNHHCHDCYHHHYVTYVTRPYTRVLSYEHPCSCHHRHDYPCKKIYVYEDYRPRRHTYCTPEIHIKQNHYRPCFNNSVSLKFCL